MATPIKIKRSAVAGKRPQVTDLALGELALNTHDAELVTLRQRAFNHTFVKADAGAVNIVSGGSLTPDDATYIPSTGVLTLTFDSGHGLVDGNTISLDNNSIIFTCDADNYQTEHTYPRATDPIAGVTTGIGNTTVTSFDINVGQGYSTEVVRTGAGATVTNVWYVTKDGKDDNTGKKLGDAKATIKNAVGMAGEGDVIHVSAGVYIEDNPIVLPKQLSIVGDSLREVTITPSNSDKDLFHVSPGNMLQELTFSGTVNSGVSAVAFDPNKIQYNPQSPYIRFCTNKLTNSIGMKVDGSKTFGPFKSMVTDSYTQYNSNGIGVSLSNEGYAQIVSMFTMNLDIGIAANSGGQCDVTNSNSSFGNYGMVSDGVGPVKYTGIVTSAQVADKDIFELDLNVPTSSISNATYDGNTGIATITTYTSHGFEVGMGITLSKLGFTCDYGDYPHIFVEGTTGGITINAGAAYTAGAGTTYTSSTGELVLDVGIAHGLPAATSGTISTASYTPSSGLLEVTTSSDHNLSTGHFVKIAEGSLKFECTKDNRATQHDYPRITDPSYNKWLEVTVTSSTEFNVNVGATSGGDFTHYLMSATDNGLKMSNSSNMVGIETGAVTFKCSKDNYASNHPYPRTTDPVHNLKLGIEAVTSDTITVNVGVSSHDIFPTGLNGNIFEINEVVGIKTFSTYVGPNRFPHTYVSGGSVENDIIRPFDGQVIYFDTLYQEVQSISVSNKGSGYTSPPTVTIAAPGTAWGIQATAVATIVNGEIDTIELISSGRGYTSTPSITVSGSGTGSLVMKPTYYSIQKSTPLSSGITTVTVSDNVPYAVGLGVTVPFMKQSRIIASSHSFEYIGTGIDPLSSLPSRGAVAIQDNEIDDRNGGLTIFTSTDQAGQFRIGDGVIIDQQTGTISGQFYSKSLFSTMTPFILALGGD